MNQRNYYMSDVPAKAGKGYRTVIMPDGSEAIVTIRGCIEEEISYQGSPAQKLGDYLFVRKDGILTQIPPAEQSKVEVKAYVRVRGKEILSAKAPAKPGDETVYVRYKASSLGQARKSTAASLRHALGLSGRGTRTPLMPTQQSAGAWIASLEALTELSKHIADFGQSEADILTGKDTQYGEGGKLKAIGYKGLLNILIEGLEAYAWLAEQGRSRDELGLSSRELTLKRQLPDAQRSAAAIAAARATQK